MGSANLTVNYRVANHESGFPGTDRHVTVRMCPECTETFLDVLEQAGFVDVRIGLHKPLTTEMLGEHDYTDLELRVVNQLLKDARIYKGNADTLLGLLTTQKLLDRGINEH